MRRLSLGGKGRVGRMGLKGRGDHGGEEAGLWRQRFSEPSSARARGKHYYKT